MRKLLRYSSLLLLILLAVISCQKGLNKSSADLKFQGDFTADQARQWYRESFMMTDLWKSTWAQSKKIPDWKNAIYKKTGDREILEFPLLMQHSSLMIPARNLSSTQVRQIVDASLKKVIFIKDKNSHIYIREIDYIPDWQYLQRKSFDISKASLGLAGDDFSGVILVKDWKSALISMRIVQDGKITKRISRAPSQASTIRVASCQDVEYCMWYEDCEVQGDQWTDKCGEPYMDPNDCYWQYECDGGDDDPCLLYGDCGGSGGGGDGGDGGSSTPLTSVTNQLIDPCKVTALSTLSDPKIKNFVTSFYNKFLVPTDSKFNLVIKEGSDLTSNGHTAPAYTTKTNSNTWEITLSNNYYTSAAGYAMSQQAWGEIIAHEIIHVAIEANNLNPIPGTDHAMMFKNFIDPLSDLLADAFGMATDDALKLALSGMNDLWGYSDFDQLCQSEYGVSTAQVQATLDLFTKGTGGTKCN